MGKMKLMLDLLDASRVQEASRWKQMICKSYKRGQAKRSLGKVHSGHGTET